MSYLELMSFQNGQNAVAKSIDQNRVEIKIKYIKIYVIEAEEAFDGVDPQSVSDTDQTGHTEFGNARNKKVIVPITTKVNTLRYKVTRTSKHVSAISCILLIINSPPPLILLPGKHQLVNPYLITLRREKDLLVTTTLKAYAIIEALDKWIEFSHFSFVYQRRAELSQPNIPAVLQLDNSSAHASEVIQAKLATHNVRVLSFQPHSTHIIQALDLVTFSSVKSELPPRKGRRLPSKQVDRVKQMYDAIDLHTSTTTNGQAFKKAGAEVVRERKEDIVKNNVIQIIGNQCDFMELDVEDDWSEYEKIQKDHGLKFCYINYDWINYYGFRHYSGKFE
ncbi:MAG: hypothetical protein EZS28_015433 [Streblomastix strix]|uniref:DDE-1 domain-containing protein n=1 Tax=Streblomastix strix TaxID=222440 RepID=A0A5J4W2A1_9EUKA|nr:MAG: hypothetical protein EZS28_015433 [Streblomastix strix]